MEGRLEPELLLNLFGPPDFVASSLHRTVHAHPIAHQLAIVLIRGDHIDLSACLGSVHAECTDDIIRLVVEDFDGGDAVGLQQLPDERYGYAYPLGGLFTLGLVLGIFPMPKCPSRRVKDDSDLVGVLLPQQIFKHKHEAEDSAGITPFGVDPWGLDEGIVGSIDEGVSIEEKEALGHEDNR